MCLICLSWLSVVTTTHHCLLPVCACVCARCRLGQLAQAGYVLEGPQQQQLADLVGVCRSRLSSMGPKQLADVVWALAQVRAGCKTMNRVQTLRTALSFVCSGVCFFGGGCLNCKGQCCSLHG